MGLIKAMSGAISGTLADEWKEYFYCDALTDDVLVAKGQKRTSKRSSNTKGEDNIISDGSHIAVADGQCMIIVEDGKVLDVCADPGAYTYQTGTTPSIFGGSFFEGLKGIAKESWSRFTFGGYTGKDQRIYYFNIKEVGGNKYGTPNPVPFKVVDEDIGLNLTVGIRCNGEYSYQICNPMVFYSKVCGNVANVYTRDQLDSRLKSDLLTALQPALAKISAQKIDYTELPSHTMDIADALNDVLSNKWTELRGIQVYDFGINSVTASKEDEDKIKELQQQAVYRNPGMLAAGLSAAQMEAMKNAASNPNGAMMGFMGLNMAAGAVGGASPQDYLRMQQEQEAAKAASSQQPAGATAVVTPEPAPAANSWTCSCGKVNTGKFCVECGTPKPADGWTCSCGAVNKGKFCSECGQPKPAGLPQYKCDKCGWEPEDPTKPPKFCPECGDPFDDGDIQ